MLLLLSCAGCAVQRRPPATASHGTTQGSLPPDLATGQRVSILLEDGETVSARVVDWNEHVLMADAEGGRQTYRWREIAKVFDDPEPQPPKPPTPASAVRRFFLLMGAFALAASAID